MFENFDVRNLIGIEDRVVIVTGGGKGIGGVYCRRLAEAGARVVVADIDAEANETTAAEIEAAGGSAVPVATDVSDEAATLRMAETAMSTYGQIDALINNASLMSVLPRGAWLDIDVERWDRVMEVNVRGVFLCCRAVFPAMRQQHKGKIVIFHQADSGKGHRTCSITRLPRRR